ncbi:MAG: hypothetical protein NVS3B5_04130 [Sphingomicrobium sp.]
MAATTKAAQRLSAAEHRHEAKRARSDTREWVMNRRERTRQLIELGGLVAKAALIDLTGDNRAVVYGALLAVADRLSGDDREQALLLWARRGHRAFEAESISQRRSSEVRAAPG